MIGIIPVNSICAHGGEGGGRVVEGIISVEIPLIGLIKVVDQQFAILLLVLSTAHVH